MGNYLERWLANSLINADTVILKQMVEQDVNLVEWSLVRWSWLESTCKAMKPFFGKAFNEIDSNNVIKVVEETRPDLLECIDRVWLEKQVVYAKKRVERM